jgi:hypothetical protein
MREPERRDIMEISAGREACEAQQRLRIRRLGVRVPPSAPPKRLVVALPGRGRAADARRHPYKNPYSYRDASQL